MFRLPPFWWSMLPAWKLIELQQAWKKGCSPVYRTNKRRIELRLRVTCNLRCRRVSDSGIAGGWLCQWLCRSSISAADLAACPGSPCWQRLCSRDSYSLMESGKYSLYFLSWRIKKVGMLWQESVSEASLNREQAGEVERLASHSYAL